METIDTEAATNFRQLLNGFVLTQARTADALDLFDDRLAFEVLQFDGQLGFYFRADLKSAI